MKRRAWVSLRGKSWINTLGAVSLTSFLTRANVASSSSKSFSLNPFYFKNDPKLSTSIFARYPSSLATVDLPQPFGPIKKKISGSIAFLVASKTSPTLLVASICLTFPNLAYISTTGRDSSLKALNLFLRVSSLSSSLCTAEVLALTRHL